MWRRRIEDCGVSIFGEPVRLTNLVEAVLIAIAFALFCAGLFVQVVAP